MSRLGTGRPLRRVCIAAAVLGTAAMVGFGVPPGPVSAAPAGATPPATIPALRSWTPGTDSYHFTDASRVVVDPASQAPAHSAVKHRPADCVAQPLVV